MNAKTTGESSHSLETYYAICKEYERLWVKFSKACNVSPAECGILFSLRAGYDTQAALCEELSMAKQTANSAIKKLEAKGLIRLLASEQDHRIRNIQFTDSGEEFAVNTIDVINTAERRVWNTMTEKEQESLITISRKYNNLFEQELKEFLNHGH